MLKEIIDKRRAYRSLEPVEITKDLIDDLAGSAGLSASCFNHQPWRYVFAFDPSVLAQLHTALNKGNEWAQAASMMIAVFSRKEEDCLVKNREYYLFDTGMATAYLILRATELGLVAHPIAGFQEDAVKTILKIPGEWTVITLVMVGRHSDKIGPLLSENQAETEKKRPQRLPLEQIAFMNHYE